MRARLPALLLLLVLAAATGVVGQSAGLPQRAPEPRTMREFWPVFLVLTIVWLGVVAFAMRLSGPYGRIAEKLGGMERKPPDRGS